MEGARPARGQRKAAQRLAHALGPFFGLLLVFGLFAMLAPPAFYGGYNLKTIVTQSVITGIGALGMTAVIISGGIDLSVGSVIALTTVVIARLLGGAGSQGAGLWLPFGAAAAGLVAGMFCGLVNGLLSSYLKIVPFIVTLGTMQIARGLAKWLGREQVVAAPESWLNDCMEVEPAAGWLLVAPGVWVLLILAVFMTALLRATVFGRYVLALGSSEAAARLCGVRVAFNRTIVYTLGGAFAGIAGIMQFANLTVGDPTAAQGMELDIIAAVVIGGGSLSGGEGSAVGSLAGALMMATLRNGCNLVGIPNYVQNIVIGVIIIGAVALDRLKQQREAAAC